LLIAYDQCRHPLPSIGQLSVEESRSPLFYWYRRTSIFELQSLKDWSPDWMYLYYNEVLHEHEFNTLSCLFYIKELCSLPDFIL